LQWIRNCFCVDSAEHSAGLNIPRVQEAVRAMWGRVYKTKDQTDQGFPEIHYQVIAEIQEKTNTIKEASVFGVATPTVQGFGTTSGFEVFSRTEMADHWPSLGKVKNELSVNWKAAREIGIALSSFNTNNPQFLWILRMQKQN